MGVAMDDRILAAFGKIWPVHVGSLTKFLITCRKAFDGDIDMFLVLAVIGDRTFSQRHADPEMDYEGFQSEGAGQTPALDINLRSIADFSGIPRETVRRKINQLVKLGWVKKQRDGAFHATSKAKKDLEPLTLASIKYISVMMQLFMTTFEAEAPVRQPGRPRKKSPRTKPGHTVRSDQEEKHGKT
jgi:hypothetical protein